MLPRWGWLSSLLLSRFQASAWLPPLAWLSKAAEISPRRPLTTVLPQEVAAGRGRRGELAGISSVSPAALKPQITLLGT